MGALLTSMNLPGHLRPGLIEATLLLITLLIFLLIFRGISAPASLKRNHHE